LRRIRSVSAFVQPWVLSQPSAPPRHVGGLPLVGLLAPVPRRTSPWKAAVAGGLGFGIGLGCYFRTKTDTAVAVALMIPLIVALAMEPESGDTPTWELAVIYGMMAVMAVYSALRAVSSNRRRELLPRRSYAERRQILRDKLDTLEAESWRVESVGDYEAVIARIARPNHPLHAIIAVFTGGFWVPVWIVLTVLKRRRPRWAHQRLFVDCRGDIGRERVPAPAGAAQALKAVVPALDQQLA